jgi:protein subunit release factor A
MTDIIERLRDLRRMTAGECIEAVAEIERLRAALESLLVDPPATPDTDAEVIVKMREIAREALTAGHSADD